MRGSSYDDFDMNPTLGSAVNVIIIGGGIVGLATAWKLHQQRPRTRIRVLEKEDRLAAHQSGHNSGVLHSGVYYKPGSLKGQVVDPGADGDGPVLRRAQHQA